MKQETELSHARVLESLDYDAATGVFRRKIRKSNLRVGDVVSPARLREALEYNEGTGDFVWKIKTGRKVVVGTVAGFTKPTGGGVYRYVSIDGSRYLAQRLAWLYVHGEWPNLLTFLDGDSLNCAISNLEDSGTTVGAAKGADGYLYVKVDGKDYVAARVAWLWVNGRWPLSLIRFRDGNKENICLANLRDTGAEPAYSRTDQGASDARRAHYESNRDRSRDVAFQSKFGIALAKYNEMLAAQDGKCAICSNPETIERNGKPRLLAVDHCHASNKVRGLLCGNCNPMIGYAKDNIQVLESAVQYLRSHEGAI